MWENGTDERANVRRVIAERDLREVPVCGFEGLRLVGADGRIYHETATARSNIWRSVEDGSVIYVGTSRHHGGVVLRPLYVLVDGMWLNAVTGKPAPSWAAM